MSVRALLVGLTLVPAFACGSDSTKKNVDGSITVHDGPGSGSGTDAAAACAAATTYPGTTQNQMSFKEAGDTATPPAFTQRLEWGGAQTDNSILDLIVVGGGGATNTPDWPTALGPATNVDVGSAATDAGYAILFITGAGSAATISDIYLSDVGTLNVTAADGATVGKSFAGNASGLTMDRYLLDGSGNITGPANDGCTSAISTTTFAANTTQGLAPDDSVMNSPSVAHTRQSVAEYLTHRYR